MIIIEGPDGAGKTTLAHRLAKDLNLRIKSWDKPRHELPNHPRRIYRALAGSFNGDCVIHDRVFYSELVYGPLFREKIAFDELEVMRIRKVIVAAGFPVICCLPPIEVVTQNVRESVHLKDVDPSSIGTIYEGYKDVFYMSSSHVVAFFDYTQTMDGQGSYLSYESIQSRCASYLASRPDRHTEELDDDAPN